MDFEVLDFLDFLFCLQLLEDLFPGHNIVFTIIIITIILVTIIIIIITIIVVVIIIIINLFYVDIKIA